MLNTSLVPPNPIPSSSPPNRLTIPVFASPTAETPPSIASPIPAGIAVAISASTLGSSSGSCWNISRSVFSLESNVAISSLIIASVSLSCPCPILSRKSNPLIYLPLCYLVIYPIVLFHNVFGLQYVVNTF